MLVAPFADASSDLFQLLDIGLCAGFCGEASGDVLIASSLCCPNDDLTAGAGVPKKFWCGTPEFASAGGCPKADPPDGCWLVLDDDPNIPVPFVLPKVLPPFMLPKIPPAGVVEVAGVPKTLLLGAFEEPNMPVDGACGVADAKGFAVCCWLPPKLNILVDGAAAAGCDAPKLNPKPPFEVPLVVLLEDTFAKGLFTGTAGEKAKPGSALPLPKPPKDTLGDPFPIGGAPFVGGKLWAPLEKRPG